MEDTSKSYQVLFWEIVATVFRTNFALDDIQCFRELYEGVISASFSDSSKVLIVQIDGDVYITFFDRAADDLKRLLGPANNKKEFNIVPDCKNLVICFGLDDFFVDNPKPVDL
jgi:hypothetical protein